MRFVLTAMLMVLCHSVCASADEIRKEHLVARTELLPFSSMTLSDEQFLKGEAVGSRTTLAGELRVAKPTGRQPLVILIHGSGGIGANIGMWVDQFNAMGISTFVLDGFTGRGLTGTNTNQALLGRLNFVADIYSALEVLAKHPRIDPQRIALMGFSRGGQAALYASLKRFHSMWNKSGTDFAVYIPFYPDCATTYQDDTALSPSPIHVFGGTVDDYNPIAKCKSYAERLQAAGRRIEISEYPNAQHSFDNPLGSKAPTVAKDNQTVRNCTIREEPRGTLINAQTGKGFVYSDSCVELNPHVGHDPEATAQARVAVAAILKQALKLE